MKVSEIVFVAIRLSSESKSALLNSFLAVCPNLDKWGKFYCDHITVEFGDEITSETIEKIGVTKNIKIGHIVIDEDAGISYVPVSACGLEHGHITIASNGMVAPVAAKQHIVKNPYKDGYVKSPLMGTMCAYMKDGSIIDHL